MPSSTLSTMTDAIKESSATEIGSWIGSAIVAALSAFRWRKALKRLWRLLIGSWDHSPALKDIQYTQRIQKVLTELRYALGADRAYIYRFHNGSHFAPNPDSAIWRMSKTHEVESEGATIETESCQNILFSHFVDFAAPVMLKPDTALDVEPGIEYVCAECDICQTEQTRNMVLYRVPQMQHTNTRQRLAHMGVSTVLATNLRSTSSGNTFGILALDFRESIDKPSDAKLRTLCNAAETLQYLLQSRPAPGHP